MNQECEIMVRVTLSADARLTRAEIVEAVETSLGDWVANAFCEGVEPIRVTAITDTLKEEAELYGNA